MHLSTDFYKNDEGWWVPACECGWSSGPVPDAETAADALMQHARERALLEDAEGSGE